jgi:squalene-hopene/tetraprenyl-beta-curcumene cyclase
MQLETPEILPKAPARAYRAPSLKNEVTETIERAKTFLFQTMKADGHWCGELESNCTIAAEYVMLHQILGTDLSSKKEGLLRHILSKQNADGSWGIAAHHSGDISTSGEVYLALRILGMEREELPLRRVEKFIRTNGGFEQIRVFTRINFALFGLIPWAAIPAIPPEFILLPPAFPINIYALSSWARSTMVPLFVISHYKPVFALPNGKSENNDWLDPLWLNPADKRIPYTPAWTEMLREDGLGWKAFFTAADRFMKVYEWGRPKSIRKLALKKCSDWILERQEPTGDWAGIFPPMVNNVLALWLMGAPLDSGPVKRGLEAIERFAIEDGEGFRIQACVSPVWDTVLSSIAILDTGHPSKDPRLEETMKWLRSYQIRAEHGDWKVYNPKGKGAGWSFEYANSWYPDVDDTLAVVLGLLKQDAVRSRKEIEDALDWVQSMQNDDGGFAAFDRNNNRLYLNEIPFSDMNALCDTSCPDITGRALETYGLYATLNPKNAGKYSDLSARAINYLALTQEAEGSWYGRWGVNYLYGTSHALVGLARQDFLESHPMVEKGIGWLKQNQNPDGGWGECVESYADRSLMGKGESTASQTGWALMGLLAYLPPEDPAIEKGIRWLISTERVLKRKKNGAGTVPVAGTWEETHFTGTGFPNHFYLRYHLYRHYFPLMALGRYLERLRA